MISGTLFNERRSKVTVLPLTSARPDNPRISAAAILVPASSQNGLNTDSLLVCVDPMTFDKTRLVQQLGQLESELLSQAQEILQRYLELSREPSPNSY